MANEKELAINELRDKVLQETMTNEGRNKFSLFSSPPTGVTSFAGDTMAKTKNLGPDGKVITAPRGIFAGANKGGKVESSFFSKMGYTSIGDPYVDPEKRDRRARLELKNSGHDAPFKSTSPCKSDPTTALYSYLVSPPAKKKNFRGEDGKVKTENRNIFTTGPHPGHGASTVGHLFAKTAEYMNEPYDRQRQQEKLAREEGKKKMQEVPFINVTVKCESFSNNHQTYGLDKPLPEVKPKPEESPKKYHDAPFKPSNPTKKGLNAAFEKYPEHKADPVPQVVRKKEDPANKKESFKLGNCDTHVRPTPSVSCHKVNMIREFRSYSTAMM